MKEVHFRIIELPTHQVLLTKDFDEEENDKPLVVITFFLDGIKLNMKLGYTDEHKRDKMFSEFTEIQAQSFLDKMKAQFE